MSNVSNRYKIIERLRSEKDMELMRLEVSKILDEELSKPAEEIDVAFVDALMDLVDVGEPSETQLEQGWSDIQKKLHVRKQRSWTNALTRVAAVLVAVIAVFFLSFETAKAFRWTHLLKVLAPVAETFGIYSASIIDSQAPNQDSIVYTDEETEYSQQTYLSLAEMPAEVDGFRIVPKWMPERFSFLQGAVYTDPDMAEASVTYQAGEETVIIRCMLSYSDDDAFSYEYERTLDIPLTEVVNGLTLSIYENTDSKKLAGSWVDHDAHYQITGYITIEELKMIVGSMME